MNWYTKVYFLLLLISFILSFLSFKKGKGFYLFPFLLSSSLLTEIVAHVFNYPKIYYLPYHILVPTDYLLWAYYFYLIVNKKVIKLAIFYSIPLFILLSLVASLKIVDIQRYPNLQLNVEGLLLIIWSTIAILNIDSKEKTSIFSIPIFWICVSVLTYYCGTFSFTGVYNFININKSEIRSILELYLLLIPNYILYIGLSIAFICSLLIKK